MPRKTKAQADKAAKPAKPAKEEALYLFKTVDGKRQLTLESFRKRRTRRKLERRESRPHITNVYVILGRSLLLIRDHWEIYGGLALIYAFLNTLLLGSFTDQAQLSQMKQDMNDAHPGQLSNVATGLSLFSSLLSAGSGAAGGAQLAYQSVLLLLISLALIWALRQFYAGNKFRVRDALYNSSYPLVQALCVLVVMCLQLLPAAGGLYLFNTLILGGIIIVAWQQILVGLICLLLLAWAAYMLTASVFAAYIVTLPDMRPLEALRSAKRMVRLRRGLVMRKVLFLPFCLLLVLALIMVPLTVLVTPVAAYVFYLLSLAAVPVVHTYMYTLYRELIRQ
jgi:hypothetical protein